ncbi:hypothetical protein HanIR_Chr02g0071731 [Helianthus annuus]|nr:hypothetical protein HanIR_Chr02g0071731 [Helianthus annuus]
MGTETEDSRPFVTPSSYSLGFLLHKAAYLSSFLVLILSAIRLGTGSWCTFRILGHPRLLLLAEIDSKKRLCSAMNSKWVWYANMR